MDLPVTRRPDYSGNGLVNVMSAIENRFDGKNPYAPHPAVFPGGMEAPKNVVLIAIDGLGFNFFHQHLKQSGLGKHLAGSITSVFPSTTAAAMTTIYSGLAPINHGLLAWFTYFKELGTIGIVPPLLVRADKTPLVKGTVDPAALLGFQPLFDKIRAHGYMLSPAEYVKKPYNVVTAGRGQQVAFVKFEEMLERTAMIVKNNPGEKLVVAYWPGYDQIAHEAGLASPAALDHARLVASGLAGFIERITPSNPDTRIIITADHGFIDVAPGDLIQLDAHPGLKETLALPLCGEPRATFCFVRPSKVSQFEGYVERHLSHACTAVPIKDVLAEELFGKFEHHPRFFDRVGDYILFMKGTHVIKDLLLGEARSRLIGYHGGTSEDEMLVPLFIA